ncbi:hypothetical protein N9850_08720 [Granulosicoccus sp.]|nr:hypothetical protein [Granulosicoccus sp.]MDB4223843.1 hypothetical protein [Granulosicoccus sp.]
MMHTHPCSLNNAIGFDKAGFPDSQVRWPTWSACKNKSVTSTHTTAELDLDQSANKPFIALS